MTPQSPAVIVTGAGSGIGRGIARAFAAAGAKVAAVDVDEAGAAETVAALEGAIAIRADVARDDDAVAAVARTVDEFGRLDALVNNAGIELIGTVDQMEPADWDRQLAVNLRGAYLFARYAIPHMRAAGGGSIVNIASVHAFVAYPGCAAYDASKAGLAAFTRALAVDHGRDGIRVNTICPGYIDTPMLERWLASLPDRQEVERRVLAAHPVGRIGTPDDIAAAVVFLCSPGAAFITGATLVVDGGMTLAGR